MRIALVCPYSLSVPGGVQGQVLGLARSLRRAGHDATVLGPADGPVAADGLPPDAVVTLGATVGLPANGSVARLALNPLTAARALRWCGQHQPDVIHLHEPLAPGATVALLARPEPKVGTFHRAGAVRGATLLEPVASAACARLAARTAVSVEAERTARALCGGTYEIVGNGIELDRVTGVAPWPTTGPTVLFVGRHEERKGLAVLLDAFEQLDAATGAVLWVAGDGPQTESLRAAHSGPAVEWLGRLDDGQLSARLAGAQVLCAPSTHGESFGVVLLEAMAARCVVVASDIPGYRAVVGDHGLLLPPGDAAALAATLAQVLGQASEGIGPASTAALDRAAAHGATWSMDAVAAIHAAVYARVAGG